MTMPPLNNPIVHSVVFTLVFCLSASTYAQEDPFADPFSAPAPVQNPETPDDETLTPAQRLELIEASVPESVRLIIRSVAFSNPKTPVELARAVETLLNVEQYAHAKFYLEKLEAAADDDAKLYEIQQVVGSDFAAALRTVPGMQPQGEQFSSRLFKAANRRAYQPARVDDLIKQLKDNDISIRSIAFRDLRRLGAPAAAAMLNGFTDASRSSEFPFLRGALQKFGPLAIPPLVAASRSDHSQVQIEAIRALGAYRSAESLDVMSRVYFSSRYPQSLRRTALDNLTTTYDFQQDRVRIEERLFERGTELFGSVAKSRSDKFDTGTLWRWSSVKQLIEPIQLPMTTIKSIAAADLADDLMNLNSSPRNRRFYLMAKLEASKRIAGSSKTIPIKALEKRLGKIDPDEMLSVLGDAVDAARYPAATAACEVLAMHGQSSLVTAQGKNSPLIKALLTGERHLQFAAFRAITMLDPQAAYEGSSYVTQLGVYFAGSQGAPTAIVGHRRAGMAASYASQLGSSGVLGMTAINSRELFRKATSIPDVDFIALSDTLMRPSAIELAQQFKRDWRTKQIPIAILISDEASARKVRRVFNAGQVLVVPFTLETNAASTHVNRLRTMQTWAVSTDERRRHAAYALNWLAKIASNRQRYRAYDLGAHERAITQMLYLPGFSAEVSKILASLGTAESQRELVNYVSQSSLPIDERRRVADSFFRSVERSGTLLNSNQIKLQYDRYNASEAQPKATQELLGSILDAIESRRHISSNKRRVK